MRHLLFTLVAALALMTVAGRCAAAATESTHGLNIRDVVSMDRVSDPQIAPGGTWLAYTVRSTDLAANKGHTQLWLMDLRDRSARAVTMAGGNTPRWSADGKQLYFLSSRSGSQQLWSLPLGGGEPQQVTDLPLDVASYVVAPDGQHIAVSLPMFLDCDSPLCTARRLQEKADSKTTGVLYDHLFVRHWDTWSDGTRQQLFVLSLDKSGKAEPQAAWVSRGLDGDTPSKPFGGDEEISFMPDSKSIIFSMRVAGAAEPWSTNFDLYQAPIDGSSTPKNLTADNKAWDTAPRPTPDGKHLIYLAMKRPGFEADRFGIMLKDLSTGATREIDPDWDRSPGSISLSEDGRTVFATADDVGQNRLFMVRVSDGKVTPLSGDGHLGGYSTHGSEVVYAANALDKPSDLYLASTRGGSVRRLSSYNATALDHIAMGQYEQFSFAGWNDEKVYGYVIKPAHYVEGRKYPVAFVIHGGPQGSMANLWHYRWNPEVFAGAGYAVVLIDFHGSTGYGQKFTDSITGDWGGKPLVDLQKGWTFALDHYRFLDGSQACALGGSYGGYMINWIAGNWPDAFKCLVNHDGIFDNRMMGYSTEELWFSEWENGGTVYDNPQGYERFNPVNYVKNWKTPMLVVHGGQDFRIPLEQGLATFTALQRRGIDSRLLFFPDENHWVLKPSNSVQWYDTVLAWMDAHTDKKPADISKD